ncbi:MAG: Gfo/Idh/MocA family oxidoreductase [Clostridiales bacterium]|nr:Gfo/Idh/MocA family oxidoreductase [Clostridiales bacterium]
MEKTRTAIIGCGKVGHMHAKAYGGIEGAELVAAYDSDPGRADAYAEQYGLSAYDSIEKMVKDAGVQVVSICVPHPLHRVCALPALEAGANVIVEKPFASTLKDCDDIITEAEKRGLLAGTVCQRRFYRPCMRIREAIDDGKLGRPVLGLVTMLGWRDEEYYRSDPWRGSWKDEGGGVLVNQAPHQIDLLLWYMGPVDTVYGAWANLNHPYIEVDDTAIAVIRFKSGALGSIVVSNSQNPALYGKVHVFGSNGAAAGVQTDGGAMFIAGMSGITEPPVNDLWTVAGEEGMLEEWKRQDSDHFASVDAMTYYHQLQLADFIKAAKEKGRPLVDGMAGRQTVELFTAIYRSNRDRAPVAFPLGPEAGDGAY